MEQWTLQELALEPISYEILNSLSASELATRSDDFFDKQHSEIYRYKQITRTNHKLIDLLKTQTVQTFDAEIQRRIVFVAYEMVFMWEATLRAIGSTNSYVYDSEAAKVNQWKSPSVQVMSAVTRIWVT